MLNELECVWTALFGECVTPGLRHNEHILNSSIASELAPADNDGIPSRNEDAKLYSLKRVLQVALDNADPELTDVAVEAVFKAREELVNVFKDVAQDQGFHETLRDAIKLITIDALNRKVKERNPDPAPSMTDVGNVKAVRGYFEKATEIKQLLKNIKALDSDIARVQRDIQQVTDLPGYLINIQDRATLERVEEYMNAFRDRE
ncbi:hypothetical protein, conserved [Babesia bigemina]|uniref:Uncharacterized protein n=1 Tax=Babesia bigemina TaxID=5866 RepID=A0A061DEP9_BABBI|nr:hypothetical protein, conserved [Babesia bigemina]CDR97660.1 hypothetical protein, conserved [Babesia bigemina]|eukprot:XP_012769846.1 hypothetical protein, conserved [Babesia bigemina]